MTTTLIDVVPSLPEVDSSINAAHRKTPTVYDWTNSLETEEGKLLVPLSTPAADGTTARVVKTSAAYTIRVWHWTATRIGELPVLPLENSGDPNESFHSRVITPAAIAWAPDGITKVFTVSGIYRYLRKKPWTADQGIALGVRPDDSSGEALRITQLNFADYKLYKS